MPSPRLFVILAPALLLAACSGSSEEPPAPSAPSNASQPADPHAGLAETPPNPHAGMDSAGASDFKPTFVAQEGWVEEQPSSSMRVRQYDLPGEDGAESAKVLVFFFGVGGGGGVEDNLTRWAGQMAQPDGSDPTKAMKRSEREVGQVKITEMALTGTYAGDMMPAGGHSEPKTGYAMRGAVVECPGGPFFVKMTGPEKTVEHWDKSFEAFLDHIDASAK